jgi:hypothetical protein
VTADPRWRLQEFLSPSRNEICNRDPQAPVTNLGVDTISTTTWLISTLLSWFRLPYATMKKQAANWFGVSIRLSRKWSVPIDRDELVKRISAK